MHGVVRRGQCPGPAGFMHCLLPQQPSRNWFVPTCKWFASECKWGFACSPGAEHGRAFLLSRGIASGLAWGSKPQAERRKGAASALKVVWKANSLLPAGFAPLSPEPSAW